jgi:uncharacterized membrane protein
MESIVIVLLLLVLGGGALFVGLIFAVVTGSARSERLRRLEQEQMNLDLAHAEALARVAKLEHAMGEAMQRLAYVHSEHAILQARLAAQPAALPQREAVAAPEREAEVAPAPPPPEPVVEAAVAPAPPPPEPVVEAPPPAPVPEVSVPVAAPAVEPAAPAQAPAASGPEVTAPPYAAAARERHGEPPVPVAPPPPSVASPPARFDWERWVGVRGAAALGACVLVIAGLYFFKYSIENELISPAMRVVMGVLVGLGALTASELTLRRENSVLANWLAGAGVAILYTAFWFVHHFGMVPAAAAFALMALVTATCGLLAVRHDAMVIALLGLLGGFATPAALSSGEDHPFGLFGYLLMLDGALLFLAKRRRWPLLGALSLVGTALYQAAWMGERMGPERFSLGIGILVVFGALYAVASPAASEDEKGSLWGVTRAATVLLPFGFGLYFGVRSDLGEHVYPLGIMLAIVSAGACWIGRVQAVAWASVAAAIAGTTVLGVWLYVHPFAGIAWEAALIPVALAAVFHAFVEIDVERPHPASRPALARAAAIAVLGTLACLVVAAAVPSSGDPWPWLVAWVVLGALALRQSLFPGYRELRLALAVLVDIGIVCVLETHLEDPAFPAEAVYVAALGVVTGLGLLSAVLAARPSSERFVPDEIAALLPFATAVALASRSVLGPHLGPLSVSLTVLVAGAAWVARRRPEAAWMVPAASIGGFLALAVWLTRHLRPDLAWESSVLVCGVALVVPAFVEVARRRAEEIAPALAPWAVLAPVGGMVLLMASGSSAASDAPWPWLAGWSLLALAAFRGAERQGPLHLAPAVALGVAFPVVQVAHDDPSFPAAPVWMAAALVTALAVLGGTLRRLDARTARWAGHAAATLALILLVGPLPFGGRPPALLFHGYTVALLVVALIVAARLGKGGWSFAAATVAAFVHTIWTLFHLSVRAGSASEVQSAETALALQGLSVVLVATWPLVAGRKLKASPWAWRAAALAAPLWLFALDVAWKCAFGTGAIGLLPVLLGLVNFAVAARARPLLDEKVKRSALAWLLGVTVASVTLAVPLQVQNEWVTIGWAVEGVALLALWRRLDHAGLKYVGLAHLAVVVLRLTLDPAVLAYHPRSDVPVLNWLAYTYWLPVAALLAGFFLLRDREIHRARGWEGGLYEKGRAVWAMSLAAAAIVVFFVWINLSIFDAFGTGTELEVVFTRLPARDLTLSLAWALYALGLLGVGMARRSAALRWASLCLIVVTIGKVFLYDLSHLHDLYRVMSLVGLALSLMLISLLYQRFVFGKRAAGTG